MAKSEVWGEPKGEPNLFCISCPVFRCDGVANSCSALRTLHTALKFMEVMNHEPMDCPDERETE